jgi:hypothetical protein
LGGGGGGTSDGSKTAGKGGSGIVIVKYPYTPGYLQRIVII